MTGEVVRRNSSARAAPAPRESNGINRADSAGADRTWLLSPCAVCREDANTETANGAPRWPALLFVQRQQPRDFAAQRAAPCSLTEDTLIARIECSAVAPMAFQNGSAGPLSKSGNLFFRRSTVERHFGVVGLQRCSGAEETDLLDSLKPATLVWSQWTPTNTATVWILEKLTMVAAAARDLENRNSRRPASRS